MVVTPPTAATQGDQPASAVAPPGIQVGPNRVEIQGIQECGQHHASARERGAGLGDPEPDQRSQPGVQVPQKVSIHVQPRGLELQAAFLQLLEAFHNPVCAA